MSIWMWSSIDIKRTQLLWQLSYFTTKITHLTTLSNALELVSWQLHTPLVKSCNYKVDAISVVRQDKWRRLNAKQIGQYFRSLICVLSSKISICKKKEKKLSLSKTLEVCHWISCWIRKSLQMKLGPLFTHLDWLCCRLINYQPFQSVLRVTLISSK